MTVADTPGIGTEGQDGDAVHPERSGAEIAHEIAEIATDARESGREEIAERLEQVAEDVANFTIVGKWPPDGLAETDSGGIGRGDESAGL